MLAAGKRNETHHGARLDDGGGHSLCRLTCSVVPVTVTWPPHAPPTNALELSDRVGRHQRWLHNNVNAEDGSNYLGPFLDFNKAHTAVACDR